MDFNANIHSMKVFPPHTPFYATIYPVQGVPFTPENYFGFIPAGEPLSSHSRNRINYSQTRVFKSASLPPGKAAVRELSI